ncbi:unnamed protein product [Candida verbasci]|uniref:Uncharacterized protein n=1 Tax=Candida verbasci TaxID=1227364 RepID=A0A9W4TUY6_9ASCO|nr:unnamed protein product [Candida verbasci]
MTTEDNKENNIDTNLSAAGKEETKSKQKQQQQQQQQEVVEEEEEANSTTVSIKLNKDKINTSTHSPSISSLSSMESTENLIKDLSKTNLHEDEENKLTTDTPGNKTSSTKELNIDTKQILTESRTTNKSTTNSPKIPQSVYSKTNFYNDLIEKSQSEIDKEKLKSSNQLPKKPIKFTVRKVSHEPIKSPTQSPTIESYTSSSSNSPNTSTSHSHHHSSHHYGHSRDGSSSSKIRISSSDLKDNPELKERLKLNHIQRKYDSYEHRIVKIQKEIEFLMGLLPPYNVETDYNTRVKINRAIDKLKMKQDEIEKKKYSLGITLSRLWRNHEGSDIWVKKFDQK